MLPRFQRRRRRRHPSAAPSRAMRTSICHRSTVMSSVWTHSRPAPSAMKRSPTPVMQRTCPAKTRRRRPPPTFESAPSPSNANARNVNFNFATTPNGTSYMTDFAEPVYAAVAKVAYSATAVAPAPGLAIARNSFNGPSYQDLDLSMAKGFHIPENQILVDSAMLGIRVDAYNVLNLTELTPAPTTSI